LIGKSPNVKVENKVHSAPSAARGISLSEIKDISVIGVPARRRAPDRVRITTDQDGLYGNGCGAFTGRADLVRPVVER